MVVSLETCIIKVCLCRRNGDGDLWTQERGVFLSRSRCRFKRFWLTAGEQKQYNNNTMADSETPIGLAMPTKKPVPNAEEPQDKTHTPSQRYLSTRGGSYGVCWSDRMPSCAPITTHWNVQMLTIDSCPLRKLYWKVLRPMGVFSSQKRSPHYPSIGRRNGKTYPSPNLHTKFSLYTSPRPKYHPQTWKIL